MWSIIVKSMKMQTFVWKIWLFSLTFRIFIWFFVKNIFRIFDCSAFYCILSLILLCIDVYKKLANRFWNVAIFLRKNRPLFYFLWLTIPRKFFLAYFFKPDRYLIYQDILYFPWNFLNNNNFSVYIIYKNYFLNQYIMRIILIIFLVS